MEEGESEANTMDLYTVIRRLYRECVSKGTHCKDSIAFVTLTVHLDVIVAPFLYELYGDVGLHDPGEDGV